MIEPTRRLDCLAARVIDAGIEVHKALGPGFSESVYEEALVVELTRRGVPFERQAVLIVQYKGYRVGDGRVDVLVDSDLVVELKAVEAISAIHVAQVISYLRAFDRLLGLLLNFNVKLFRNGIRRIVVSPR